MLLRKMFTFRSELHVNMTHN